MDDKQGLARIPLCRDAGLDLTAYGRRCTWRTFEEGAIVVDYEDSSTDVCFILSGDIRVLIRTPAGKEIILADMKAGQFFGELSAIDAVPRSANVTAMTRAEICLMPAQVFRDLCFASPVICERVLKLLAGRVRELNARVTEQAVLDVRHRLYSELLRLSAPRKAGERERIISPPPFHHDLAARIGCRREQVTREFSALAKHGIVDKRRGALVILQPETMEQRIAEAMRADD